MQKETNLGIVKYQLQSVTGNGSTNKLLDTDKFIGLFLVGRPRKQIKIPLYIKKMYIKA